MSESAFNAMTAQEMREILERLALSQRGLARMLGTNERTVRRYVSEGKGARNISPELAILLRLLDQRPELLVVLRQHFPEPAQGKKRARVVSLLSALEIRLPFERKNLRGRAKSEGRKND